MLCAKVRVMFHLLAWPFVGFGASILAFRVTVFPPREHPSGPPREQQDGLEVVLCRILFDFGLILGLVYISFLHSRSQKFHVFELVSRSYFSSISESKFRRLGLPNRKAPVDFNFHSRKFREVPIFPQTALGCRGPGGMS